LRQILRLSPALGRLLLPVCPLLLLGHLAFDIGMSFLEDPDAVADDDVALVRLKLDEDDVRALFLRLGTGGQVLTGYSACLNEIGIT
jgi:hypothetical protein